jgi:hypothetical protein
LFLIGLSLPNTMLTLMFSGGALDKPESSARIALKV